MASFASASQLENYSDDDAAITPLSTDLPTDLAGVSAVIQATADGVGDSNYKLGKTYRFRLAHVMSSEERRNKCRMLEGAEFMTIRTEAKTPTSWARYLAFKIKDDPKKVIPSDYTKIVKWCKELAAKYSDRFMMVAQDDIPGLVEVLEDLNISTRGEAIDALRTPEQRAKAEADAKAAAEALSEAKALALRRQHEKAQAEEDAALAQIQGMKRKAAAVAEEKNKSVAAEAAKSDAVVEAEREQQPQPPAAKKAKPAAEVAEPAAKPKGKEKAEVVKVDVLAIKVKVEQDMKTYEDIVATSAAGTGSPAVALLNELRVLTGRTAHLEAFIASIGHTVPDVIDLTADEAMGAADAFGIEEEQ